MMALQRWCTPKPQLIRLQPVAEQQPLHYYMGVLWSQISFDSGVHQRSNAIICLLLSKP